MAKLALAIFLLSLVSCLGQSNYDITQTFYKDRTIYDLPWNAQAPNITNPDDPFAPPESRLLKLFPELLTSDEVPTAGVPYKRCSDAPVSRSDTIGISMCKNQPYATGCETLATPPFYKCVCEEGKACKFCNVSSTPCSPLDQYCDPVKTLACKPSGSCEYPVCTCKHGYDTDWDAVRANKAKQCDHDIDECATNPCSNGGTCHNVPGNFYCDCTGKYTGINCDIKAGCDQGVPCAKAAVCKQITKHQGDKSFTYWRCVCKMGYTGNPYVSCGNTAFAKAVATTDPHFRCFDDYAYIAQWNQFHDYMGTCPVTLTRLCEPIPHIPDFKVVARSSKDCDWNGYTTCIRNLYLQIFNHTVMFTTVDDPTIVVDSQVENLPYKEIPGLNITLKNISMGIQFTVNTSFAFSLEYAIDNVHRWSTVTIWMPTSQSLSGKLCGLAGPMTGIPNHDMVLPDGSTTDDENLWGDSWSYENLYNPTFDSEGCLPGSDMSTDPDVEMHNTWAATQTACAMFTAGHGPFEDCFNGVVEDSIVGEAYFKCVRDTGATLYSQRSNKSLILTSICSAHLVQFSENCRTRLVEKGWKSWSWRAAAGCPTPHCPPNSYFEDMAPDCDNTCEDPHAADSCVSTKLEERCFCNKGYVLSMGACIPRKECPGYHDGLTYVALKNKTNLPCTTNCVFLHGDDGEVNKGVFCKQVYCVEHSKCYAKDGIRDCLCDHGYVGDGRHECKIPQQDCVDLQTYHGVSTTGVSPVNVWAYLNVSRRVYCDMETNGGGWTVIQRRVDTTDFNRTWQDYIKGFGNLEGSFWYGLEMMHKMTNQKNMTVLRIELEYCNGSAVYQEYEGFRVGPSASNYILTYESTAGTAGDAFASDDPDDYSANGVEFSSWDNDHDAMLGMNCAIVYDSGWWHRACTAANLNGKFYENCGGSTDIKSAVWLPKVEDMGGCPKKITMKLRKPLPKH